MACVDSCNTGSARSFARCALEVHTGKAVITASDTLSLREKREVAVLLAGQAIGRCVSAGFAITVTFQTVER